VQQNQNRLYMDKGMHICIRLVFNLFLLSLQVAERFWDGTCPKVVINHGCICPWFSFYELAGSPAFVGVPKMGVRVGVPKTGR